MWKGTDRHRRQQMLFADIPHAFFITLEHILNTPILLILIRECLFDLVKMNFRSIFSIFFPPKQSQQNDEAIDHDQYVGFYYTNLINSLILFSLTKEELEKLEGPGFDVMFELYSEIDYTPVCFETVFRTGNIDLSFREELLDFRGQVENVYNQIWEWEYVGSHPLWLALKERSNDMLNRLGIDHRTYNEDYLTVYDQDGNILKRGNNVSKG